MRFSTGVVVNLYAPASALKVGSFALK